MLISVETTQKWNNKNKKYYIDKGYIFTLDGDEFKVKVSDLSPYSKAIVDVKCDYCGRIIKKKYQTYNTQHHDRFGDCCQKCQPQKNKLVCMDKYGVDNGSKTVEAINKIKQTSIQKYGVDNPAKSTEARHKISAKAKVNASQRFKKARKTNRVRYGCDTPFQNKDVKNKIRETMLERYGVTHPKKSEVIKERERQSNQKKYGANYYLETDECKQRIRETNMKRYGYPYSLQAPSVRAKCTTTILSNGSCSTSKPQIALRDLLISIYGACELNKPCGNNFLDCVIEVNSTLIDVEYDGRYWHQDKNRDRRRDEFVKSQGYKVMRISGDYSIPTKTEIEEAIDYLVKGNHKFVKIELDM